MNALTFHSDGIIGSVEEVVKLANKDSASILITSDSHGDSEMLKRVILSYGAKADALIFCGDGVMDLLQIVSSAANNNSLYASLPPVIVYVRGNNDSPFYDYNFPNNTTGYPLTIPKGVIIGAAHRRIWVTHGNSYGVYYSTEVLKQMAQESGTSIVAFGHTHCPFEAHESVYLVNGGGLSFPRSGSKPGFAFMQIASGKVYSTFYAQMSHRDKSFSQYTPMFLR